MQGNFSKIYLPVLVILLGFSAVYGLSKYIESVTPEMPEDYIDQDLSLQGEKLKGYAFGMEGLIADWYWMQSLQYIGNKLQMSEEQTINLDDLRNLNPKLLYPYLDNATTLDPHFMAAYSYGAIVLPAIDPRLAVKLTEKGIKNNPDEWLLYQHLGYIYWRAKKYKEAAEVYEKGAEIKNAPQFMKIMATRMLTEGESRETAREIYSQMYEKATDSKVKENAELRLMQLDSLDEQEAIQKILDNFKAKNKRCVKTFQEIFPALQNVKLSNGKDFRINQKSELVDPTGAPYLLDPECKIKLDPKQTKIPLSE